MQQAATPAASSLARFAFFVFGVGLVVVLIRGALVAPASMPLPAAQAAPTAGTATRVTDAAPAAAARNAPFTLTASDAELTRAAAGAFPQTVSGLTLSDPVVRVQADGVRLVATAKILFGTTQFVMMATPIVRDGRVTVRVDSATLAGVGLPDASRASIADTMQGAVARLVPANVRVTAIALSSGTLSVNGVAPL